MKTSSSAKRVTQVKSAGGYKASTVIWEVNFNQIYPEFGPNTSFIGFRIWSPNWGFSNTPNVSAVCESHPSLPVLLQKHFLLCVCVYGSSCFLSQRCLLALALISSFPAMSFRVCASMCVCEEVTERHPEIRKVTTSRDKTTHTCVSLPLQLHGNEKIKLNAIAMMVIAWFSVTLII